MDCVYITYTSSSPSFYIIKGTAIECDNFQVFVLLNWDEYKEHKKLRNTNREMPFNNWYPCHAKHFFFHVQKLTMTAQKHTNFPDFAVH